MDTTGVNDTWSAQKSKLKLKFAALTDSDLLFETGKKEEMIAKLQIRLGKTKEEIEALLKTI
ncbi:general stress protein CsbD [Lacinutrix neustonica]|uniref:General stress protein CsbD n=1 Tax=Lacinutrix neustonica TaxID=2980107 RepID=A0A9E8SF78_9FLAO|nr:general stress protein CsbD [Lacinutrix neustonica]WAC03109.1 general stress protein CsbD [Lacinutrix neustonica]